MSSTRQSSRPPAALAYAKYTYLWGGGGGAVVSTGTQRQVISANPFLEGDARGHATSRPLLDDDNFGALVLARRVSNSDLRAHSRVRARDGAQLAHDGGGFGGAEHLRSGGNGCVGRMRISLIVENLLAQAAHLVAICGREIAQHARKERIALPFALRELLEQVVPDEGGNQRSSELIKRHSAPRCT